MFILYISSFLLTFLGFPLGKSTEAEHKELKRYILFLNEILKFLFYIILVYLFYDSYLIILFLILFVFYIIAQKTKSSDLMNLHNILVLSLSILFIDMNQIFFVLIFMFALIFENSLKKFYIKEEIYSLIFYLLIYIVYMFF